MRCLLSALALVWVGLPFTAAQAQCFFPGGGPADEGYGICNSTAGGVHSVCCDLRNSVCTTTGLCAGSAGYYYRGGCTDRTFKDLACPQDCVNGTSPSFPTMRVMGLWLNGWWQWDVAPSATSTTAGREAHLAIGVAVTAGDSIFPAVANPPFE